MTDLKVAFVCGDPTIFIGNQRIAKVARATLEGEALTNWAKSRWDSSRGEAVETPFKPAVRGQQALAFMGGSVLVTPTHAEFVFRDDDLEWDDENNAYRWFRIPANDYRELGEFLMRGALRKDSSEKVKDISGPAA